jgi:hypothetical protein
VGPREGEREREGGPRAAVRKRAEVPSLVEERSEREGEREREAEALSEVNAVRVRVRRITDLPGGTLLKEQEREAEAGVVQAEGGRKKRGSSCSCLSASLSASPSPSPTNSMKTVPYSSNAPLSPRSRSALGPALKRERERETGVSRMRRGVGEGKRGVVSEERERERGGKTKALLVRLASVEGDSMYALASKEVEPGGVEREREKGTSR